MKIRFGYELVYNCPQPVPMILMLQVHPSRIADLLVSDRLVADPAVPLDTYIDCFGNTCTRIVAPAGITRLTADGLIPNSAAAEAKPPRLATARTTGKWPRRSRSIHE